MVQRFSPEASVALQEALSVVYHYKRDLRKFLQTSGVDRAILNQLDWDQYKRHIVSDLLEILIADTRFLAVLTNLCRDVASMEEFPQLARTDDPETKITAAKAAVRELRRLVRTNRAVEDEAAAERRRLERAKELQEADAFKRRLGEIRSLFADVSGNTEDPQKRGRDLEKVMRDLFDLFDLDPKASFKIQGEQIDGAFTLDGTEFIFEAKWEKERADRRDLDIFAAQIKDKLENTLGLFLSINGFQETAVSRYSNRSPRFLLMEGPDLSAVLEEMIDFREMLQRKKSHASRTGEILLNLYPVLLRESYR